MIRFLKNKIKKIKFIYKPLLHIKIRYFIINPIFSYNKKRFIKYSSIFKPSILRKNALLTLNYHVIEKGLTMPDFRFGFGYIVIRNQISCIKEYIKEHGVSSFEINEAIAVLGEYLQVHNNSNFKLPDDIENSIKSILKETKIEPSQQIETTRKEFFGDVLNAPFEVFSKSRHTVRDFSGEITIEQIEKSIELANYAPSACNRQPCIVHLVTKKQLIQSCMSLQNGNRGFGHLADKLLILTADLNTISFHEINDLYTNAGIYLMNLTYSLHKNKIASCILNWSVSPKTDLELRKTIDIPENETIVSLIALGSVPEKFKIAKSTKKDLNKTLVIH